MKLLLNQITLKSKIAFAAFAKDESGEVNVVAIVVLIGIALLLALLFKEQISGLLESMFNVIKENATNAVNDGF